MIRRALLAALLLIPAARASDGPGPQLSIGGRVELPTTYTLSALAAAPALEVQAARDGGPATFVGTPLWPLIAAAKPLNPSRADRLQHVLVARGRDGYAVVLALAEIDPDFEGKPVLVAYKMDGALLPAPRLVVPGDKRAGRNVRDLVAIDVQ